MIKLNMILVDDEYSVVEGLCIWFEYFFEINIVGSVCSVDDVIELINNKEIDLIFLDIEMFFKLGFELIKYF